MRATALVVFALIVGLASAPAAAARSFVIEARGSEDSVGVVKRIGDYRPYRNPRLGAAIRDDADVRDVIELLRLNYDRVVAR